jgi:hypothetical protein
LQLILLLKFGLGPGIKVDEFMEGAARAGSTPILLLYMVDGSGPGGEGEDADSDEEEDITGGGGMNCELGEENGWYDGMALIAKLDVGPWPCMLASSGEGMNDPGACGATGEFFQS